MVDSTSTRSAPTQFDTGSDDRISGVSATAGSADLAEWAVSPDALARFEFEKGKANEGTKILMVEWEAYPSNGSSPQDQDGWEVDFEGKAASFSLSEEDDNGIRRVYFLIAPQVTIPPTVTISQPSRGRKLTTKSMPAIFAPGLGVDSKDAGKRGVLHTLWAKKRLSHLQNEIRRELQDNSEGIGLEMAIQERQWILDHFGLEDPDSEGRPAMPQPTPQSPRSPIGGRLGERLRGLKLATSSSDLRGKLGVNTSNHALSLSPPESGTAAPGLSVIASSAPVSHMTSGTGAVGSLDAMIGNETPAIASQGKETEDELFALPMSPRSPEMKTSPFSLLR